MGKVYERKTDRQSWGKQAMIKAVAEVVRNKKSVHSVAKAYGIPESTLRRYLKKSGGELVEEDLPKNAGRWKKTFNDHQIEELKNHIAEVDKAAFGLTRQQLGRLCFDFAERRGISHRFNQQKRTAGKDFIAGFMQECALTLRTHEATSLTLLSSFSAIEKFFDTLKGLRNKHKFLEANIYNVGEKGFSVVPLRPTEQSNRRAIKATAAESDTNFTSVCAMSPSGCFVPPLFIFPQVSMNSIFMEDAPPGSEGIVQESGKLNASSFLRYLEHFVKFARPSEKHHVLLIMDNHASYVTLESVDFCREHFIHLLGLPPHTSHKLDPLHVAFYGPLETAYYVGSCDFIIRNPDQRMSVQDVAAVFCGSYLQVANARTAIGGFEATGIEPINSAIFTESSLTISLATVFPQNEVKTESPD